MKNIIIGFLILYSFGVLAQPTITSFTPASGPVGTTVTITGTNFNATAANDVVFFGSTRANVSAASATSLTVNVPVGSSYKYITVTNLGTNLTAYSAKPFDITFSCGGSLNSNSFATHIDSVAGTNPRGAAACDIDGDGKPDMVVTNYTDNTVSVFRNTGSAGVISFATDVIFASGTSPESVSFGDFNGDGKPDMAVANLYANSVSVYKNTSTTGNISFSAKIDLTTGDFPQSICIGDLNGDGKPDVAVVNINSATVSVFKNTSSSTTLSFAAKADFTTGSAPRGLAIGDIDGDGKPDLAAATSAATGLSVLRNTYSAGTVSFAAKVDFTVGTAAYSVAISDFDGDGKSDIAVANSGGSTVSVLRNTSTSGTITLAAKVDLTSGSSNYFLTTGDLDGDGKPDIALANGSMEIFKNTCISGTISFAAKIAYSPGGPLALSICDLDEDSRPDIIAPHYDDVTVAVCRNLVMTCPPIITSYTPASGIVGTTITITGTGFNTIPAKNLVFFGATQATVSLASATSLTVTVPAGATYNFISVTDLTSGLIAYSQTQFIPTFNCGGEISTSSFATKVDFATGTNPHTVALGDLNADSRPDMLVSDYGSNAVSVYKNTSTSGTVSFAGKVDYTTGTGPWGIKTGDLDADGKPDLVVANSQTTTISVLKNNGSGVNISFAAKVDYTAMNSITSVAIGDFNCDGKPDIACSNQGSNTISVFKNTGTIGTISFASQVTYATGNYPYYMTIGDIDGDGKQDIIVAIVNSSSFAIFRNTSTAGAISFAAKVDIALGTNPYNVSVGDLDGDGKLDLAIANGSLNTISILRNTSTVGTISFATKVDITAGASPNGISISDLDGDGKPDLAVTNSTDNSFSLFKNNSTSGTISFASKVDYVTGGTGLGGSAIGDMDGDGKPDLAIRNYSDNNVSTFRNIILVPPIITGTTPNFHCGTGTVDLSASASAGVINWYSSATGGSPEGTGSTFTTPSLNYTTTYYIDATYTGCTSFTRTPVVATIYSLPNVEAGGNVSICNGNSTMLNATGDGTDFSWSPSTGLSNPSVFNPSASPTSTTNYTVVVTDAHTCTSSDNVTITVYPVFSTNNPQEICLGDSYTINGHNYTTNGTYNDTLLTIHGCDSVIVTQITVNDLPLVNAGNDVSICMGNSTQLNATGGTGYNWSPAADLTASNISNPVADPVITTEYIVTITDLNGCMNTDTIIVVVGVPFADEVICLVTVDTITWKNKVMWEKTSGVGTIGYNVFKEVSTNVYSGIGFVPFDSASYYIDISSNPVAHGDKYKISLIDTCTNESAKSPYHKTMNLVISSFGSTMGLSWTPYEDESGIFIPAKYYIYRGTQPDNLSLLDSVTGSFTSYNDANVFSVYYYIIAVEKDPPCNLLGNVLSFSNKKDNSTLVNIDDAKMLNGTILISPNPMSTTATLTIPNFKSEALNPKSENRNVKTGSDFVLRISDLTGKIVRFVPINELNNLQITQSSNHQIEIERGDLKPGIYFVELNADRIYRGKLIVE